MELVIVTRVLNEATIVTAQHAQSDSRERG